jgi:large subunit ribosomal protein L10
MLTRSNKEEIVRDLSERIRRQEIAVFTKIHKISVEKSRELRRSLQKEQAEYRVARKTLLDRALKSEGIEFDARTLDGEVGIAIGYGDQVALAKILNRFSRENDTFEILSGILKKKVLTREDVVRIAKLPSREIILSQLLGVLQSPVRGFVTVLQGNIRGLVTVLDQIKSKKTSQ